MVRVSVKKGYGACFEINADVHGIEITEHIACSMNTCNYRTNILGNYKLVLQCNPLKLTGRVFV